MKEQTKRNYSFFHIWNYFLLNLQSRRFIPSSIRVNLVKMGVVNLSDNCLMYSDIWFNTLRPELITLEKGCCIVYGAKIISHFWEPDKFAKL